MQSRIAKPFKRLFKQRMGETLPMFRFVQALPSNGDLLYSWRRSESTVVFILVIISLKHDAFTIEAAWSDKERYPFHIDPRSPRGCPRANIPVQGPIDGEFRFRIPSLWDDDNDPWWNLRRGYGDPFDLDLSDAIAREFSLEPLPEIRQDRLLTIINDALSKVEQFVLPFVIENCRDTYP